jgi:cytochrome c-type protein NapC
MTIPDMGPPKPAQPGSATGEHGRQRRLLHISIGGLAVFLAGVLFWGAFNTALEAFNTEEFCISCHEMRDNVYQEYRETVHFKNAAGVRATCPDCHVPRAWLNKVARKIQASNELLHWALGTIDTREKFLAHRAQLAQKVWDTMKVTDSRECRNYHALVYMKLPAQSQTAQKEHASMAETDRTCIDCHKGIAHQLPQAKKANED